MQFQQVSDELALASQLSLADFEALVAQGFKTFINNRPDGEGADQPPRAEFEARAKALGVTYHYLPLEIGQMPSVELAAAFQKALKESPMPAVAYCRSGNRSGQILKLAMTLPAHESS
ncbi:MAG: TIGR01244 family sulfur transferase [Limnobacter sp.]|nr:TIGR01244 family sulfur transferase [Limnobacter sp.]